MTPVVVLGDEDPDARPVMDIQFFLGGPQGSWRTQEDIELDDMCGGDSVEFCCYADAIAAEYVRCGCGSRESCSRVRCAAPPPSDICGTEESDGANAVGGLETPSPREEEIDSVQAEGIRGKRAKRQTAVIQTPSWFFWSSDNDAATSEDDFYDEVELKSLDASALGTPPAIHSECFCTEEWAPVCFVDTRETFSNVCHYLCQTKGNADDTVMGECSEIEEPESESGRDTRTPWWTLFRIRMIQAFHFRFG